MNLGALGRPNQDSLPPRHDRKRYFDDCPSDGSFYHPDGEEAVLVFSVAPTKILAFAKGAFSHTRHRF